MTFKLRSGNTPKFKQVGSSPAKDMKTGSYKQSFESPAKQIKTFTNLDLAQDKLREDDEQVMTKATHFSGDIKVSGCKLSKADTEKDAELREDQEDKRRDEYLKKHPEEEDTREWKNLPSKKKSPAKQAPGGGAGEAIEHWKKYKSKQKNIKELDKFLHGTSKSRAAQRALDAKKAKKAKGFSKTAKKVVKKAAKKSIIKKVGGKILSRFLPGVGWGLLAHDVIKTAPKVAKATKKSLKKQAKGQSVGFPKY